MRVRVDTKMCSERERSRGKKECAQRERGEERETERVRGEGRETQRRKRQTQRPKS